VFPRIPADDLPYAVRVDPVLNAQLRMSDIAGRISTPNRCDVLSSELGFVTLFSHNSLSMDQLISLILLIRSPAKIGMAIVSAVTVAVRHDMFGGWLRRQKGYRYQTMHEHRLRLFIASKD
jgi:hypothetical protein